MTKPTLIKRNEKAFREHQPAAWKILQDVAGPITTLVKEGDSVRNIDLGSGNLYATPEPQWTKHQMDAFRDQPDRTFFTDPSHCNLSPISLKLLDDLRDFLQKKDWATSVSPLPVVDVGYVFVFGVGLGLHLQELVDETPARHIILIEPIAEFIFHSFSATDWKKVFTRAEERGIAIHFVLAGQPDQIVKGIETVLFKGGVTFLDGSYYCPHYYSWTLQETYTLLKERLKHFYISFGFFEDELEMIKNCYENMKNWSFRLVEGISYLQTDFPIFIVGSGPSLDKDLAHIRKWREHAIVLSCGTALRILLKNGIRPDLHCENERVRMVPKILRDCRDEFGLDGITLLATTTADPTIANLFDNRWYYFRSALSPTTVLGGSAKPIANADPLVTNAGFAIATTLGFQNVYFFGIDCGQKKSAAHHAKDSIYYQKENADLDKKYSKRPDREVPGNFGGTVQTFWAYDLGRRMLGEVQTRRQVNLFNCSDGAQISGAQPKIAAAIDLSGVPPHHQQVLQRVEEQMRAFTPGQMLDEINIDEHIDGCRVFTEEFKTFIAAVKAEDDGFWEIEQRLDKFWADQQKACKGFFALAFASMSSMVRLAAFFGNRIADEEKRHAFLLCFADAYEKHCLDMAKTAEELLLSAKNDAVDLTHDYAELEPQVAAKF